MSVTVGTRLGPYEIQSPLGHGGMGEVYKARDTRLDRTVAIKVLPEALASDPVFRERFDREAKAIAALQHPHICTLYDVGYQDGIDYLVLEFLDGQTLAERLTKGALPIDQALTYAIQIADALDKAHRAGIVHRDLKPGNVMVTKSGVKLLDFGLAKTSGPPSGATLSMAPTAMPGLTAHGTILGTFQYMAPEQLEGKEADARTDIFAFGAVVYEMVTGKKAFEGKSQASLISAIMSSDPAPMATLQPISPPALDRAVKTCLAKDPDRRWQNVGDLCRELKWIAEGGEPTSVSAQALSLSKNRRERLAWAVAALAAAGLFALSMVLLRETLVDGPETRTDIVTPSTSDAVSFALSPDGRQIVFVASGDGPSRLWLRRLDTTEAQPLVGTEGASYPFWSPDGRSVAFFADNKLKRLDLGGGSARALADVPAPGGRGGTWGPDGTILFTRPDAGGETMLRIPASGGGPVAATRLADQQTSHRFPQFLPDGRRFLFYAVGTADAAGMYLGSLDASETTRLGPADAAAVYAPAGWVLFIRGGTLLGQRLDLARSVLTGDPVTVADAVAFEPNSYAGAVSVSADGLVAYRSGGASPRQLVWFDRSGKSLGMMGAPDTNGLTAPRLSRDGHRAAVYRAVQGNLDVWLVDATRTTRLTFDARNDQYPVWSPDGSQLVIGSGPIGRRDLYLADSSNPGREQLLLESAQDKLPADWSRDGRFLLYHSPEPQTSYDIWVLPMEGDQTPSVWLKTPFDERRPRFSPDGRWMAYQSNQSGRYEVYVRPFNGASSEGASAAQWLVSTAGGMSPRWRSDGRELYYIAPDGQLMAAPINVSGSTLEPGTPVALFQTRIVGGGTALDLGTNYDVSDDGRFLINTVLEDATAPITLLMNWQPELAK